MSFTAIPMAYQPPRVQASTPVETYGPVPATVIFPKLQAPEGARFCEEVNAFVPTDLQYRIRGIRNEATRKNKRTFVQRMLNKPAKNEDTPLVMAMGLTHVKLNLVPLSQAQQNDAIRYHGMVDDCQIECTEIDPKVFKTELIPLWEAQTRSAIIYRGDNPLRSTMLEVEADAQRRQQLEVDAPLTAPLQERMREAKILYLIPPSVQTVVMGAR